LFAPRLLRGGGGTRASTSDPDETLVRACQEHAPDGCQREFRELYERHQRHVYTTCLRLTGNDADALDAAQDTFCTVHDRIDRFHFRSRFSTWLCRIATYTSLDVRARSRRRRMPSLESMVDGKPWGDRSSWDALEPCSSEADDPLWCAVRREQAEGIRAALRRLSPRFREVIELRYLEGMTYAEIASELDLSPGTVKSRMSRAHQALDRLGTSLRRHLA